MTRTLTMALFSSTLVFCFEGTAFAEGFALSDWGARGSAMAGGMVGRADDPSAVAHNPAGITQLPGTQAMGGLTMIAPMGKITTIAGGVENTTKADQHYWLNPHAYLTHQLSDDLWLGVGGFSRFGLGDSFPHGWPGSANLVEVKLKTVSLNPSLAWKLNDHLSLAFGVEVMGGAAVIRKGFATPFGYNGQKLSGQGVSAGFNLAAHYRFNEQWAMGLTYRSPVNLKIRGDNRWDKQLVSPMLNCDVSAILHLPDSISFGVTWKPVPAFSIEAGTVYTIWSRYKHLNIEMESPVNRAAFADKHWKDTWNFNVGMEYKPLDWLSLRAGYSYETSPMNDSTTDYMTPTDGRHRFTSGLGFRWDRWALDLSYAYIRVNRLDYTARPASYMLDGAAHGVHSHVAAMSVGYTF